MSEKQDKYQEFAEYFTRIVEIYSKDQLVLTYNLLYLTKGLLKSPIEVRNKVIDDICHTSYQSIVEVFQLKRMQRIHYQKLLRIINDIRNNNVHY